MLRYKTHLDAGGLYNTPSTFGIYVCALVFEWILAQGGLEGIGRRNEEKAKLLYDAIDRRSDLFRGHSESWCRSKMNVTFTLVRPELDADFLEGAKGAGMMGLAGHRSVGGMRASIYNAMTLAGVEALVGYMQDFERRHG